MNLLLNIQKEALKGESKVDDQGRKGSRKRAALSTDEDRSTKAAPTEASSDKSRLEDISVLRRQMSKDAEFEA